MAIFDARPSAFNQMSTTGEWEALWSAAGSNNGIDATVGNAMLPSLDTGGRNAVIADGNAHIKGMLWRCDASVNTPIPAASAQNRIDRLVLRLSRGAGTSPTVIQPVVITGTPSGSPVIPPIVQTSGGIWDFPVSHWTSTSAGGLTSLIDERRLTNDLWRDMRPLSGSFFGTISGFPPPQYRFSDDLAWIEFAGYIQTPIATGNYNGTTFFTLPPNYRPVTAQGTYFLVNSVADGAASPVCRVGGAGTMQLAYMNASLAQTVIGINGRIPLEDVNGFIQT